MDLRHLRRSYGRGQLDESALPDTPATTFTAWLADAVTSGEPDPTAMTLATVGPDGRPSSRVVLLKGHDAHGLVFYTNYRSRKAREIEANPHVAAQFHWPELERVVRVEGTAERVTPRESDEYFATRPLDSRIGAWASPQSEVIANRAVLLANAAKASAALGLNPPRPDHWGGYRIVPEVWEFWQGRPSRLHDRVRFRRDGPGGGWVRQRLAP